MVTTGEDGIQAKAGVDQYLTFMLAGEEYGVDILKVQEIKGWDPATPIPNSPEWLLGVINLRGTVVPVVDLRRRFGLEEAQFGPTTVIIVLKVPGAVREKTVGIVVDAVSEVYNVAADAVTPPPEIASSAATRYVRGLARVEDKMVILLDSEHLLDFDAAATAH